MAPSLSSGAAPIFPLHPRGKVELYCHSKAAAAPDCSYRAEDLLGLLQDGDLGPVVPLEDLDPRRVVDGGRRVRPEERGEALPERQSHFEWISIWEQS